MIGQTISHYRVTAKLGVGGMGVVYEAKDERLLRLVALKFLPEELTDDPDAARRLRREAQTIALLSHPNICTIYEVDEFQGRTFLVMERLNGRDLKASLAGTQHTTQSILRLALDVAAALNAAHGAGIVHRDIKPGNLFIGADGHVKVLDFGLARRFTHPAGPQTPDGSSIPGRPIGTIDYMAPERILQRSPDPRCDLFSLGVVMYEMATGRKPFTGESPFETVMNILDAVAVPLAGLSPDRPREFAALVHRLIERDPERRCPSAQVLTEQLSALLSKEERGARRPLRGRSPDS